jgi:hypothetical protein
MVVYFIEDKTKQLEVITGFIVIFLALVPTPFASNSIGNIGRHCCVSEFGFKVIFLRTDSILQLFRCSYGDYASWE